MKKCKKEGAMYYEYMKGYNAAMCGFPLKAKFRSIQAQKGYDEGYKQGQQKRKENKKRNDKEVSMKTREQYMEGECTYREYYAQFVTEDTKQMVVNAFGVEAIKGHVASDIFAKKRIPLKCWDALAPHVMIVGFSLSDCVCVLNEAARQVAEGV